MQIAFNEDAWILRVMGIDNGTSLVGISILEHDLRNGVSTVIESKTIDGSKFDYRDRSLLIATRGEMMARIRVIQDVLTDWLEFHDPHLVAIESPFSHIHVDSFKKLTISLTAYHDTVYRYNPLLEFLKVPPGSAKKCVIPKGTKYDSDKGFIRSCILSSSDILEGPGVYLEDLGPDAIDSIAVARYGALTMSL